MFVNNLKLSIRTLGKNKLYTLIHILGLCIGIAAVLLIYHMVTYELSFNKYFENYERIVRIVQIDNGSIDGPHHNVCVPAPAMDQIEEEISQFESLSRIKEVWANLTVPIEGSTVPLKKFTTSRYETGFFVEPSFFEIFDFNFIAGDPSSALKKPGSIILSQTWADKCFDNWKNALGKTVLIDNLVPAVVEGVFEDSPANSDFPLPYLISYETLLNHKKRFFYSEEWGSCSSNSQVYALMHPNANLEITNNALANIGKEEYQDESGNQERTHFLQPLSDLHYDSRFGHSGTHTISLARLKVLAVIGLLILAIACFNFINLTTAQSVLRAKEVGVRKTLGGTKGQLIAQFMGETGIIVFIALIAGSYIAYLAAPLLGHVSYVPATKSLFANPMIILFLIGLGVAITIMAGLYPAFALAHYKPARALKTLSHQGLTGAGTIRKTLVVLQFGAAIALIISSLITLKQLDYIKTQDLGFDKDLIYTFYFNNDEKTVNRQEVLRNKLLQIPNVTHVSLSSDQPISGNTWSTNFRYGSRAQDEDFSISLRFCDQAYFETYNIPFISGQAFKQSDTMHQCVVNMTTLRKLGIDNPQEVIGQSIRLGGGRTTLPITGVVEDFHTHSFRKAHEPLLLTTRNEFYGDAGIKLSGNDVAATILSVKEVFDNVLPEQVFVGSFLDEDIARFYEGDNRLAVTCWSFGFLAIFISCLGLFGLATHTVTQRIKEIGIRKVLGASATSIVTLLSKDFLKLILIALVIATPIAWWSMEKWLENFVYRISISVWIFITAGLLVLVIAFLTVGYQSLKAAIINPVKSLRNE